MIEAEYAERIGFTQAFAPGADEAVGAALHRLQALGVRHLRLPLTEALCTGPASIAWLARLLARLAPVLDVTPALQIGPADSVPDWVRHVLGQFHGAIDAVEICATGPALHAIGQAARAAGCRPVLAVSTADPAAWLQGLGETGALAAYDAVGLHHMPAPASGRSAWSARLAEICQAAHQSNPDLAVWITHTGYAAWRHDAAMQAQLFVEAAAAPAERMFWSTLFDQPDAASADPGHAHGGVFDQTGQPKLLGRLLEGGVAEVERVLATARRLKLPAITATRPVLVTGGAGFIGANLADRLAAEGHHVYMSTTRWPAPAWSATCTGWPDATRPASASRWVTCATRRR